MSIKALIFDFDGLILDTESPDFMSWQELFEEYGCSLPLSVWAGNLGTGAPVVDLYGYLEQRYGSSLDRPNLRIRRRERHTELVAREELLPGVAACIDDARLYGLRLGVASSSSRAWVSCHLRRLGILGCFDCVVCAEDVDRTKPAPDLYLRALELLQTPACEALALEDSPHGVTAAKQAGLLCVAVPSRVTRQLPLDHADFRLASLADLSLKSLITCARDA